MAGNILGESFSPGVVDQINARQSALGKYANIPPETIKALYARSAFLRLASSVDIDPDKVKALGFPGNSGNLIAKQMILFGGTSGVDLAREKNGINLNQQSGLNRTKGLSGAYGFVGGERGLVPMPGIVSANVGFYNRGSLAKAEIKIKAYSREQLALIDALYMRPGFTILLEWGWTVYLTNSGTLGYINSNINSSALTALFYKANQYTILNKIKKTRKATDYNYDGFYGKISKFSWNFNADGSYDITVSAIGLGDIIDSLKINVLPQPEEK